MGPTHILLIEIDVSGASGLALADRLQSLRPEPQNPAHAFPPLPVNATIVSIVLVFDEGSDQDPDGSPEIVLDNIFINGKFATRP